MPTLYQRIPTAPAPTRNECDLWISYAADWVLDNLPRLNKQAIRNALRSQDMADLANRFVLRSAPPVEAVTDRQALGVLTILGMIGSSVERHAQQQQVIRAIENAPYPRTFQPTVGEGLKALIVGESMPFTDYFETIADKIGHPRRDSFTSFIENNGPRVEVRHPSTGSVVFTVKPAFESGRLLTFSNTKTERNFLRLVKETYALQAAANLFLETVHDTATAVDSSTAVESARTATELLLAIQAQMVDFMRYRSFDTDFFLDEFRQYQCEWYPDFYIKPPSAANDGAALHRDLMLFVELLGPYGSFPGFHRHVEEVCTVLLPDEANLLRSTIHQKSIERKVLDALEVEKVDLQRLPPNLCEAVVGQYPWLEAYRGLYNAQRAVSRTHFGLVRKYLIRPQQRRRTEGDLRDDITVVDNNAGVTGMDPNDLMVRLNQAREHHFLDWMNRISPTGSNLDGRRDEQGFRCLSHSEYLQLSTYDQPR